MNADECVVRSRYVNLYRYPIYDGNIVARPVRGTRLEILDEEKGFLKIRYYQQIAYVNRNSVALIVPVGENMNL